MADGERPLPSSADDVNHDDAHAQPPLVVAAADEPLVIAAADEDIDASLPADSAAASDHDAASLSILALQHRVALLKARTLQHQQLIAEMRRREQELEVSILRRQLAQLREQVSDRADQLSHLRNRCRLVSELAQSVNRVMETRTALASGKPPSCSILAFCYAAV